MEEKRYKIDENECSIIILDNDCPAEHKRQRAIACFDHGFDKKYGNYPSREAALAAAQRECDRLNGEAEKAEQPPISYEEGMTICQEIVDLKHRIVALEAAIRDRPIKPKLARVLKGLETRVRNLETAVKADKETGGKEQKWRTNSWGRWEEGLGYLIYGEKGHLIFRLSPETVNDRPLPEQAKQLCAILNAGEDALQLAEEAVSWFRKRSRDDYRTASIGQESYDLYCRLADHLPAIKKAMRGER